MPEGIVKRDGRLQPFDINKIEDAVFAAARSVGGEDRDTAAKVAQKVVEYLDDASRSRTPKVEDIQDAVERTLIHLGHAKTAKAYILYRQQRSSVREMDSRLMQVYNELNHSDADDSDIKRENANVDGDSAMGTMLKFGSEGAKEYYCKYILKPEQVKAHLSGDIHIHDMDFYTLTETCCQIDIVSLFAGGFGTGHGFIREPNDIRSYAALAAIAIQANQNDQHGGQSIPNFDYGMAPGVMKTFRKTFVNHYIRAYQLLEAGDMPDYDIKSVFDTLMLSGLYASIDCNDSFVSRLPSLFHIDENMAKKLYDFAYNNALKETTIATEQAMEGFIHNLNTMHSRAGAQVPFSSVNYGTDTSAEGRMVIRALQDAINAGLGNGETAIFPISIFKVKSGVNYNPEDVNYDLFQQAMRVSAKRLFPNFSFLDSPFNAEYYQQGRPETEVAYMGCRTRVMANVYDPDRQVTYGRGNLSFTSINLPRIAMNSYRNIKKFYGDLETKLDIVCRQLLDRLEIQKKKKAKNYPFLMGQGVWIDSEKLSPNDAVGDILNHGTLTIGFIGLAEALVALTGKHHGESAESQRLGLDIISYMRDYTDRMAQRYKLNFSLIATPAEGLSGRFVKMDRKIFGDIEGITDREYYTNSFHIPVYYNISAFKKIELEAPYHALTNGGHISYVELDGDTTKNIPAFERIIRHMAEQGIGYGSINHPVDRDSVCGYNGIIGDKCPQCGRTEHNGPKFERIRRITGYLVGTVDRFNNGKRAEERDRVKHNAT